MKPLPAAEHALVVRTDFSNQAAWDAVRAEISEPVEGFRAYVHFVDDPEYADAAMADLIAAAGEDRSFIVVADRTTIMEPEHPVLVVELFDQPGRSFRALPSTVQSVENNLSIANMDFEDFTEAVGEDGIFRGFSSF